MTTYMGQHLKTADILHCKIHTEVMVRILVPRQEQQRGVGVPGEVVWKLLCVLREGETRTCRAWCTVSRYDVVGGVARAGGGEE